MYVFSPTFCLTWAGSTLSFVCRYVVHKDAKMNAVYVSLDYFSEDKSRNSFTCSSFNWINGGPPQPVSATDSSNRTNAPHTRHCTEPTSPTVQFSSEADTWNDVGEQLKCTGDARLFVKVRHGPNMYECKEFKLSLDGSRAQVLLSEHDQGLAGGQYAVFYQRGECLGCGVIE